MELLEFARGPALSISIIIFIVGVLWRMIGILALPFIKIPSRARTGVLPSGKVKGWFEGIWSRMWPHKNFVKPALFSTINGYVFHIGLFIVVFLFAPHVVFIKDLTGLSWGSMPSNLVFAVGVITATSMVAALIHRLTNPVQRLISNFNDYFSWFVTLAPVLTGLLAVSHLGPPYEKALAIHLLSVALLLIWFPFGKLMHAFLFVVSRGATGARMKHRGAQI